MLKTIVAVKFLLNVVINSIGQGSESDGKIIFWQRMSIFFSVFCLEFGDSLLPPVYSPVWVPK